MESKLKTADLKSTLEAKINAISTQLDDMKNAQLYKKRDGLEEITNQRFESLHEVQQQQIQMQTLMMNQLMNQKQNQPVIVQSAPPVVMRERVKKKLAH